MIPDLELEGILPSSINEHLKQAKIFIFDEYFHFLMKQKFELV